MDAKVKSSLVDWAAAFILIAAILAVWRWGIYHLPGDDIADRSSVTQALFAALAFAGVLATLWMQRKELQMQREDQEEMRKAQQEQARSLKISAVMQTSQVAFQASSLELSTYIALLQSANAARTLEHDRARMMGVPHTARDDMVKPFDKKVQELEGKVRALTPEISLTMKRIDGLLAFIQEEFDSPLDKAASRASSAPPSSAADSKDSATD
jgi:hypothetical protein